VKVVIIGGSGHASDVLSVLEMAGIECVGFQDDNPPDMRRFKDRAEHIGRIGDPCSATHYAWGLGYPTTRQKLLPRMTLPAATLIHPRATVHPNVRLGEGTVVMAGAILSAGAVVGDHVLIHHNAVIGHDCQIGDFVSVMPGAAVSGDTVLEEACLIGCNAAVIQGLIVGARSRLGAGSVATRDIPPDVTAIGSPARVRTE
jgi:sugar O-acyltransferase (sialic acid O-acetyltransferase NeuD family)